MTAFRLFTAVGALGLLAAGLSACVKEPSYSNTPAISFNRVRRVRNTPADPQAQPVDTIFITVNYQDGDGDLGGGDLSQEPYKSATFVDDYGIKHYFLNNYFVVPLVRDANHKLVPIDLTGAGNYYTEDGTLFQLSDASDNKAVPLRGTITRRLFEGLGDALPVNRPIYFQIQIADRAMHLSNVIITPDSLVIPPR